MEHRIDMMQWEARLLTLLWPIYRHLGQIHRQETVCEAMVRNTYLNLSESLPKRDAAAAIARRSRIIQLDDSPNVVFIPTSWMERTRVGNEMFEYLHQRILEVSIGRLQNLRRELKFKAALSGYSDAVRITRKLDLQRLLIPLTGPRASAKSLLQILNAICKSHLIVDMETGTDHVLSAMTISIVPLDIFGSNRPHYPVTFGYKPYSVSPRDESQT